MLKPSSRVFNNALSKRFNAPNIRQTATAPQNSHVKSTNSSPNTNTFSTTPPTNPTPTISSSSSSTPTTPTTAPPPQDNPPSPPAHPDEISSLLENISPNATQQQKHTTHVFLRPLHKTSNRKTSHQSQYYSQPKLHFTPPQQDTNDAQPINFELQEPSPPPETSYPILTPEKPFIPRVPLNKDNVMDEWFQYLKEFNKEGVRASVRYMRANRIPIDTKSYSRTIAFYANSNDHEAVARTLAEMKEDGVPADNLTYITLLNHACNRGSHVDFDNALATVSTMNLSRQHVSMVYNLRLKDALTRNNPKQRMGDILEEMQQKGIVPDEYTYNNIMRYHAGKKDLANCLRVLNEMRAANMIILESTFDTVFRACTNDEQVQQVLALMRKMNVSISAVTFNRRIQEAANKGDLERCREVMHQMTQAGATPDVVTYNSVLQALTKQGQMQESSVLLQEMLKKGLPDEVTFNTIAIGWAMHKYFSQALELVAVMRNKQIPTTHALTSIIYHMILNDELDSGLRLFHQVGEEGNAGVAVYNSVIYSLLEARAENICEQVYAQMRERGVNPDHATYQALVVLAVRNNHDVLALRDDMRKDSVEPNEGMFNTLLRHSKGPPRREFELIKEMREKGFKPENHVFLKVMKAAGQNGDVQLCKDFVAYMHASGDFISSQVYHLLFLSYVNSNNDEGVWSTVAKMRDLQIGPTDETYKVLLDYLQRSKDWEKCVEILKEMETNHVLPVGLWQ